MALQKATNLELPRQNPACVDVAGVGLNGLVVTQDLGGGGGGHGSQQQTVSHPVPEENNVLRQPLAASRNHTARATTAATQRAPFNSRNSLCDLLLEGFPVPQVCWSFLPHVILKDL